jgi:hypothetical protein
LKYNNITEREKYYNELLSELSEVKTLEKGYKYGVASVLTLLYDWISEMKYRNIDTVSPKNMGRLLIDWIDSDEDVKKIFKRLTKNDSNQLKEKFY